MSAPFNPDAMLCFRSAVFKGADMWNPNLREYPDVADITAALSKDRYGIAYAGLAHGTPDVKPIALGIENGDWVQLSPASVADRKYPLARSVYVYIDPGQLENAKVREFLTYILSRE